MRKFVFWITLILICIACSAAEPDACQFTTNTIPVGSINKYTIVIHDTVPATKVTGIIDAAAEWMVTTSGRVTYQVTYAHFDPNKRPPLGEVWVYLGPPDPSGKYIGMCSWWFVDLKGHPGSSLIWIDSSLNEHMNFLVSLHEFGHSIGLPHSDEAGKPSIMIHYITDVGNKTTCYDRQAACKLWDCDPTCSQ